MIDSRTTVALLLTFAMADAARGGEIAMHREGAGQPDASGWCKALSTGGKFSVLMPNPFKDFTATDKTEDGADVKVDVLGTLTPTGAKFSAVSVTRSDGKPPIESADEFAESFRKSGVLRERREVMVCGRKAIRIKVASDLSVAHFLCVQVGPVVYQLAVEYPAARDGKLDADIAKFFGSLELPAR